MCLAVFAWQSNPDYPLVLAANRDEFYARSTRAASWWGQSVAVLAGRDEEAGGTWLGINRAGRLVMLTNIRAPSERNPHAPSRGAIVLAALQGAESVSQWFDAFAPRATAYNGFNLLGFQPLPSGSRPAQALYYTNKRAATPKALSPGLYGLSNAFLDTPWPKVTRAVGRFACTLARRVMLDDLLDLMADRAGVRDALLPSTGVALEWERALAPIQIRANGYGTRSTTIVTIRNDGLVNFLERSFDATDPQRFRDRHFEFMVGQVSAAAGQPSTQRPDPR